MEPERRPAIVSGLSSIRPIRVITTGGVVYRIRRRRKKMTGGCSTEISGSKLVPYGIAPFSFRGCARFLEGDIGNRRYSTAIACNILVLPEPAIDGNFAANRIARR